MEKCALKVTSTFLQGHPHKLHVPPHDHSLTHYTHTHTHTRTIAVVRSDARAAWKETARSRQIPRVSPISARPKSEGHLQKVGKPFFASRAIKALCTVAE